MSSVEFEELRKKIENLNLEVEVGEEYVEAPESVKKLVNMLLEKLEEVMRSTLNFSTIELKYLAYYLNRWRNEPKALELLEKVMEEIKRRES